MDKKFEKWMQQNKPKIPVTAKFKVSLREKLQHLDILRKDYLKPQKSYFALIFGSLASFGVIFVMAFYFIPTDPSSRESSLQMEEISPKSPLQEHQESKIIIPPLQEKGVVIEKQVNNNGIKVRGIAEQEKMPGGKNPEGGGRGIVDESTFSSANSAISTSVITEVVDTVEPEAMQMFDFMAEESNILEDTCSVGSGSLVIENDIQVCIFPDIRKCSGEFGILICDPKK